MNMVDMYAQPTIRNAKNVSTNVAWERISILGRTEDRDVDKCANDDGGWTWKKSDMHRKMLLNSHTPPK